MSDHKPLQPTEISKIIEGKIRGDIPIRVTEVPVPPPKQEPVLFVAGLAFVGRHLYPSEISGLIGPYKNR